ncbi:sensor histidine kinase [Tenacibaculum agarivorans]|uniref:sensor histidine kinase n=1 Tax=Tenacibaculum agarivorans TaxID=1908389 RepID=UPI00094BB94E|nr:histidine kinase [Tenacibaculum agarivorans]
MRKSIFSIRISEVLAVIGVYLALSFFYHVTLYYNRGGQNDPADTLWSLQDWYFTQGLQYTLMFVATAIVWFFIFRICRAWTLKYRLLLHFLGLPFFILFAKTIFYKACEVLGYWHLDGNSEIWDIYIPALFYLIQFSIFHAYEHYIINQRRLQYEIELKNAALKSELSAIKAQLNPHFLYNVFNTINASVPKEMEETREMIAELADLFRYQLKASREDLVTLKEELEFVTTYLKLEQKRFEDRLSINISVPDNLLSRKIPPMILQPLVENSVKHGISPLVKGGHIDIIVQEKDDKLVFEINDTGIGVEDKEAIFNLGVGLSNTQKRLQKMYQSTLQVTDNFPSGLKVQFEL